MKIEVKDRCIVCNSEENSILHSDVQDYLTGKQGKFDISVCDRCSNKFLTKRVSQIDIHKYYEGD